MALPLMATFQKLFAQVKFRHGQTFSQQQDYAQAIAMFSAAIASGYAPIKAKALRGYCHWHLNAHELALADFESVIEAAAQPDLSPESRLSIAQACTWRGQHRQQQGDEAAALADWSMAIDVFPSYAGAYYHRAKTQLGQGLYKLALVDLDAAIEADPTLSVAYLERGNLKHQLGDIPAAVADWTFAMSNDYTLEAAKQKLETVKQAAYDQKLSEVLIAPLGRKGLTATVQHGGDRLEIHVHRPVGTGINYAKLPDLIREHLAPLHLADVSQFELICRVGDVNRPDWRQTCELYKGLNCPTSNWQAAFSALVLFPPLGIPAFVQAFQVKRYYQKGEYIASVRASKSVKGLCIASSIALGIFAMLPLGYAAYESRQEPVPFKVAKQSTTGLLGQDSGDLGD